MRMSLFSRKDQLPGLHGPIRDCTPAGRGLTRLGEGDIAVIDIPDLTRKYAQGLADARPAAVVNVARFSTGNIPNFGPQLLLDAGITLVENTGAGTLEALRDGKKGRLTDEGELFQGNRELGRGALVTAEQARDRYEEAQQNLTEAMEAYFGNTVEFINREAPLLIDGLGIPDVGTELEGRCVLVASPGPSLPEELEGLSDFIQDYDPALIGVAEAADDLYRLGLTPTLIVGNPTAIDADTLRSGARVILPADPDGHAEGLERIQDLGVGALTFPAATTSPTDLALLLADYHGADLIVHAGERVDLDAVFAGGTQASPSALLSRSKVSGRLITAEALMGLYRAPARGGAAWLWAIVGVLVAAAVVIIIAAAVGDGSVIDNLITTWNNIALEVQSWVS